MFLPFLEVDIRQQAVDEMMQRIKKGVQLRPVNHSPRRAKRQVLLSPFESTWCPDMGLGGFSLNQKHIQLYSWLNVSTSNQFPGQEGCRNEHSHLSP